MHSVALIGRLLQQLGKLLLSSAHDNVLVHRSPNHPTLDTLVSCTHVRHTCMRACRCVMHGFPHVSMCANAIKTNAPLFDGGEYSRSTMAHPASDGMESRGWRYEGDEKVRKGRLRSLEAVPKAKGRDGWRRRESSVDACTTNYLTKAFARGCKHCIEAMHRPACCEGGTSTMIDLLEKRLTKTHGFAALATPSSESSSWKS